MAAPLLVLQQAAQASNAAQALDALAPLWVRYPAPALDEAIAALDGAPAPFEGDTDAFLAAAKKARPRDRGPLLAAMTKGTLADVQRRLEAVTQWPADPRTSRAVEGLLSSVPWSSDSSKRAWTAAFALMQKQNDARFVALSRRLPATWKVRASMQQWLERAFARAVQALDPLPPPSVGAAEGKALAAIVEAFRAAPAPKRPAAARDEAALFAAVYADPDDDGVRQVLADALQEKGDPRGEFIALQMAGDARAKRLLKANQQAWLGPLAPVLSAQVEFRRGFPAVGRTKFRHQADAEKCGALVEWATFEALEWGTPTPIPKGQEPYCCFIGPAFRHLKVARGPWLASLLAAKQPWSLEDLSVAVDDSSALRRLGEALPTLLPKLKRLEVQGPQGTAFPGVPNLNRLEELALYTSLRSFDAGWEPLQALEVPTLTISVGGSESPSAWRFTKGAGGRYTKLVVTLDGAERITRHDDLLRAMPDGFIESFEVVATGRADPKLSAQVRALLVEKSKRPPKPRPAGVAPAASSQAPLRALRRAVTVGALAGGDWLVMDVSGAQVVRPGTKEVSARFEKEVSCAAISPDGTQLAVVTWKQVSLHSLPDFRELWSVPSQIFEARALRFVADGLWHLARTGAERLDLKTGRQLESLGAATRLCEVSADGKTWLRGAKQGGFVLGPAASKKGVAVPGLLAALLPNGDALAVDGGKGPLRVCVIAAATGEVRAQREFEAWGWPAQLVVSKRGSTAVMRVDAGFVVVDVGSLTARYLPTKNAQLAGFSADEKTLLMATTTFETQSL